MWTLSGSVALDLNRIPRPAKEPKKITLKRCEKMLAKDGSAPTLNLFKNKQCRGWWPMVAKDNEGCRMVVCITFAIYCYWASCSLKLCCCLCPHSFQRSSRSVNNAGSVCRLQMRLMFYVRATEPDFAEDISAIEVWLIDLSVISPQPYSICATVACFTDL